jgi:purine-binding chemotaxis protein CheW
MDPLELPQGAPENVLEDELLEDALAGLVEELAATAAASPPEGHEAAADAGDAAPDGAERLRSLKEMLLRIDERTRAARSSRTAPAEASLRCLTFSVTGRRYAVPLTHVTEVGRVPAPVPLPHVAPWLLGLTSLRGHILAMVDLQRFLTGRPRDAQEPGRLVIARSQAGDVVVGLVVDAVHGIREFPRADVGGMPEDGAAGEGRYVRGASRDGDAPVLLLDVEGLLGSDEMKQVEAG